MIDKKRFEKFGPRWGLLLDAYFQYIPDGVGDEIKDFFARIGLYAIKSPEVLRKVLSLTSEVFKKQGSLLSPNWKYYVGMQRFGGYIRLEDDEKFIAEIKDWITGDKIHTIYGDEELFLDYWEEEVYNFLCEAPSIVAANDEAITLDEYVDDITRHGRSGSSHFRSTVRYVHMGKVKKTSNNKWARSVSVNPEQLKREILSDTYNPKSKAIPKSEFGKIRPVVASNDQVYNGQNFVAQWLEGCMRGHPGSSLFFTPEQSAEWWLKMTHRCRDKTINLPIDIASNDHQPNRRMDERGCRAIRRFIATYAEEAKNKNDLLLVWDKVTKALLDPARFVQYKDHIIASQKGLESGLRLTSFFNTCWNKANLRVAARVAKQRKAGFGLLPGDVVEGDDMHGTVISYASAIGIVGVLKDMNFDINEAKFFLAQNRSEMLRKVVEVDRVSGYTARAMGAIFWRNPISRDPPSGILRAREQLLSWSTLISRGADPVKTRKFMVRDIGQGNGLSNEEVIHLLHTPRCLGGLGYDYPMYPFIALEKGRIEIKNTIVEDNLEGLKNLKRRWANEGVDVSDLTQDYLKSILVLPSRELEVFRGEVRRIGNISPVTWSVDGGTGVPLRARGNKRVPTAMGELVLMKKIREKDDEWIETIWLDPPLRDISERIRKRGGRGLWLDWVTDKLPFSSPIVDGFSEEFASVVNKRRAQGMWARVVSHHKFGRELVNRVALRCELETRWQLENMKIKIGP
jgi:hypothetical protein